jgi:hypothetical protein
MAIVIDFQSARSFHSFQNDMTGRSGGRRRLLLNHLEEIVSDDVHPVVKVNWRSLFFGFDCFNEIGGLCGMNSIAQRS